MGICPLYTIQHTLGKPAHKAHNFFVANQLKYGIDGPLAAFTQVHVFSKVKPNLTERHVLFDDSENNSSHMLSIGMQLPMPVECILFLHDAKLILSVDMPSFFMQLCLAEDIADFWTYDSGSAGKVHNLHMVQGNSKSPAIAQTFLTYVLASMPELQPCLMVYIDNVYLMLTTSNKIDHIHDIGLFAWCLVHANTMINMSKSLWCMAMGIKVLGHQWSANQMWQAFDHWVETMQALEMMMMVTGIWHLCKWIQIILAPFYQMVGKTQLTKDDIKSLYEPWHKLKQALLDVRHLYILLLGAPLVLHTDAAGAGMGATLLAQL
ncbi:hypothetical protein LPJ66_006024 [Kickxella alabastrina]|uniref:Uncharacterized protein n=1 Tax=Kickxella alabastrina TaxID=61397 RepID=A0ACC1IIY2_9FUNG|nr:hypothetical protein LPJ66_006024 [Kickxella alabastrina]